MNATSKPRIVPIAIAIVASLLGFVSFLLIVFVAPSGRGASAVWRFIQDGGWGVYGIFLLTLLSVLATAGGAVWLTLRRSAWSWVPAVLPFFTVVASALFEAWGIGKAVGAVEGESIDPGQKYRILAEGTSEATVLSILGAAAGCALYGAIALVFGARALSRVPSGRFGLGALGALAGGLFGFAAVGALVLLVPMFRETGFGFGWIAALGGWLGAVLGAVAVADRSADESARGEALGDLLLAGIYSTCAIVFASAVAHGTGFRQLTGAMGGESVDPSQAARIAVEGLAEARHGLLCQLLWVVPVGVAIVAAGLPAIGRIGGALKSSYGGIVAALATGLLGALLLFLPRARHETRLADAFQKADVSTVELATVKVVEHRSSSFRYEMGTTTTTGFGSTTWQTSSLEGDGCVAVAEAWKMRPSWGGVSLAPDAALPYKRMSCFIAAVLRAEPDTTRMSFTARTEGDSQLPPPWGKMAKTIGNVTFQLRPPGSSPMKNHVHLTRDAWELRTGEKRETLGGSVAERIGVLAERDLLEGTGVTADPDVPVGDLLQLAGHSSRTFLSLDVFKTGAEALAPLPAPDAVGLGGLGGFGTGDGSDGAPRLRAGAITVQGRLPPEVIQRIVRQQFGRFRMCYEAGLKANPKLSGRVSVRFVIGRDGSVASATDGGSDLPDTAVVSCVVRAFQGLSFPQPEGGIVSVSYPILFESGGK